MCLWQQELNRPIFKGLNSVAPLLTGRSLFCVFCRIIKDILNYNYPIRESSEDSYQQRG